MRRKQYAVFRPVYFDDNFSFVPVTIFAFGCCFSFVPMPCRDLLSTLLAFLLPSLPDCSPGHAILGPLFELHVWRGVRSGCDQQRGFLSRFPGDDV